MSSSPVRVKDVENKYKTQKPLNRVYGMNQAGKKQGIQRSDRQSIFVWPTLIFANEARRLQPSQTQPSIKAAQEILLKMQRENERSQATARKCRVHLPSWPLCSLRSQHRADPSAGGRGRGLGVCTAQRPRQRCREMKILRARNQLGRDSRTAPRAPCSPRPTCRARAGAQRRLTATRTSWIEEKSF